MSAITDVEGRVFRPYKYEKEQEFESSVLSLADRIFGPSTIYIDVKKRVTGNDIVTIPDGYVVDMTEADAPRLFVVENEIVTHDPFKHIGIQMLKFATSFDEARVAVRKFLMAEIARDEARLARLDEGTKLSGSRNIDDYLERAVEGEFHGLVIIDEAEPELYQVLKRINADISVLQLKTFVSETGVRLHEFETLYDEEEDEEYRAAPGRRPGSTSDERASRRARRAASDTIVVPAREEGFKRVFLGQHQWYAIRVGAAMKERIKYIAAYQVAPVSAVTHIAEVREIHRYQDSAKYIVVFKEPATELERPVPAGESYSAPQGPVYVQRAKLLTARSLQDAMT